MLYFLQLFLCLVLLSSNVTQALVSRIMLSKNGPEVSRIAYGTLHLAEVGDAKSALLRIQAAIDMGITTFDLSDCYSSGKCNKIFGEAINLKPELRAQIQVIAKMDVWGGYYDTSVEHLDSVMNDYLNLLNTSYVDIVLLHRQDYLLDVSSVSALFYQWKAQGKVHYFGTSNFDQNSFLNLNSRIPLSTNEIEVSVWAPETIAPLGSGPISPDNYLTNNGLVDFHYRQNMSVLAWGPLGGDPYGGLNRLFKLEGNRQNAIRSILKQVGQSISNGTEHFGEDNIALGWILKHPARIVPIIGTMNVTRIKYQSRSEEVAKKMTRKQWYEIAKVIGLPLP